MKLKNILKYVILALLVVYLSACTNNTDAEQLFDKTPTERLNAQKAELNEVLLTSEFGWKAVYFTDDTQLGGFTHLFKFLPGNKVEMASDFNADTKTYTSDYNVVLGSSVSLLFDTYNRIHLLSDSNSFPTTALRGKGYLGDFQFLYYGQENGDIIFKSNRLVREVRFVKATAEDWVDLPKNLVTEQNVIGSSARPLFRLLEVNTGSKILKYDFNFTKATRYALCRSIDAGSSEVIGFGIGYTPTGIVVSPALTVEGQKLTNFVYNATDGSFTATGTGGVSITIKYSNSPLVLTDDYKTTLPGKAYSRYGYYADDTTRDASTNSALFNTEIAKINSLLPAGQKISTVQIYFNHTAGNFIYYTFTGRAAIQHFITVEEDAVGKKIILKNGAWTTGTVPAYLKDFDKYLVDAAGLYVKKEAFKLGYSNDIYTFTVAGSAFRMTTYKLN